MMVVVSGVGTGIGKTHVSCAVLETWRRLALSAVGLKPIESGGGEDGERLQAASTFHVQHPPPYQLPDPVSPHLAARRSNTYIDLSRCVAWTAGEARRADRCVVELAGGLFSPLGPGFFNVDLLRALDPNVWILVACDRLGVLHEITSTLIAIRTQHVSLPVVLLTEPETPDASTGDNARELAVLRICTVLATFPRRALSHPDTTRVADALVGHLETLG